VTECHRREFSAARKTDTVTLTPGDLFERRTGSPTWAGPLPGDCPVADSIAQEGKYPGVEVRDDDIALDPRRTGTVTLQDFDQGNVVRHVEASSPARLG
jgi:hypothetical protein